MDVITLYSAGDRFVAGEIPTADQWNDRVHDLHQEELVKRDSYLRGYYPATGAPTLQIVGQTVVCTDLDAILDGVRLAGDDTWNLSAAGDGTYYLQVEADGNLAADTTEDAAALTVGTVVVASGVLSSLTVTLAPVNDNDGGDMTKAVYDTNGDGVVNEAATVSAGGVNTAAIATGAVTADKLGSAAVTTAKIDSNAVTAGKIATGAVETAKLADSAVTASKIADDAVTVAKLDSTDTPADGEYLRYHAASGKMVWDTPGGAGDMRRAVYDSDNDGVVDVAELALVVAPLAVTSGMIANETIGGDKLVDQAVTEAKIALDAVTTDKIADGAVTAEKLSLGSGLSGTIIQVNTLPPDALNDGGATPDDGEMLTYSQAGNNFSWQTPVAHDHDHTGQAETPIPADGIASGAVGVSQLNLTGEPSLGDVISYGEGGELTWAAPSGGLTSEEVHDLIDTHLVAGADISLTPDDEANTITIAYTGAGGGLSAEEVHDLVDTHVVGTTDEITATPDDEANTLTLSLAEAVTDILDAADAHVAIVAGNPHGTTAADVGAAEAAHNHDSAYAAANHNHDSAYAAANHDHDEDYAAIGHDHDSDYLGVALKGAANGVAELGADGKVPASQLPAGNGGGAGTLSKGFVVLGPTSDMDFNIWKPAESITITSLQVLVMDGTNVVGGLDTIMGADGTFATGDTEVTSFTAPTVTGGTWVAWHTTSVSGYVTSLSVTIEYEVAS